MVLSKILSIGNKIELINVRSQMLAEINGDDENKKIYYSQVYDLIDESRLKIAMPIEGGKVVPLGVNSRYDACFYTPTGLYQCRIVVVDRYKEENIFVLVIEITTELQKYQRRQYYRLGCTLDIKYRLIEKEELEDYFNLKNKEEFASKLPLIDAIALDISGGGIRFVSREKHSKESELFLLLEISYDGKEKLYGILGKIISVEKAKNRDHLYEYRVEYKNIEGTIREQLIKFIFEEERKQRKRATGLDD